MGELLALGTAVSFSVSGLLIRRGQRDRPFDNGLFMTTVVNLMLYVVLTGAAWSTGRLPSVGLAGVLFFTAAGVTNTLVGRWAWFQSVRAIGPSRATALKVSNPVFASILAAVFLRQVPTLGNALGIICVIGGVVVFSGEMTRRTSSAVAAPSSGEMELGRGMALGLGSALAYGCGAVLRAAGLGYVPSPFFGALVGAVVATGSVLMSDAARGNLGRRWADNVRDVPFAFVAAGVLAAAGQLTQFASLQYTTVARSTVIASAEPLITMLLAALVFRRLDTVTARSAAGLVSILAGVAFMVLL